MHGSTAVSRFGLLLYYYLHVVVREKQKKVCFLLRFDIKLNHLYGQALFLHFRHVALVHKSDTGFLPEMKTPLEIQRCRNFCVEREGGKGEEKT